MTRGRIAAIIGAVAVIGALAGWSMAGVYAAWRAPPVPAMPPLPGGSTFVLDAEVFTDQELDDEARQARLAAVAQYLDTQRPHDVKCAVSPPIDAARGLLSVPGAQDSAAFVVLGHVYLTTGKSDGTGTLALDGFEKVAVTWRAGDGGPGVCDAPIALFAVGP